MNYNSENKGFVCYVYNLQRGRVFWIYVAIFGLIFLALIQTIAITDVMIAKTNFAKFIIIIGALTALIAPKTFALKILAYVVIFLGVILGIDYSNSDFGAISQENYTILFSLNEILPSFFGPNFELKNDPDVFKFIKFINLSGFVFIAIFMFVMLIGWFVYNARSSEINEI
ncbi:MAG: hypothetical protein ACTTJC_07440 [Campylobacter sp.]